MSVYLGSFARMIELKCPSSQQVSPVDRYSLSTSLEGQVQAQVRPLGRREWSLNVSAATPADVAPYMAFVNGEWGNGPFNFVSADALVTNLLTPSQASCDPVEYGGAGASAFRPPMLTTAGWVGRSIQNDDVTKLVRFGYGHVPVVQGRRVTAAADLLGANAVVQLWFFDAASQLVSTVTSLVAAGAGVPVRSFVTALPPAGAVSCFVVGVNATQAARPSITWTDTLFDYADGQGCVKAILRAPTRDLIMATNQLRGGRYSSLQFTVSEVG